MLQKTEKSGFLKIRKIKNKMFIFIAFLIFLLMHTVVIFWFCQNTPGLALTTITKLLPLLLTVLYVILYALARKFDFWTLETILSIYLGSLFLAFALVMSLLVLTLILKIFHITLPFNLGFPALGIWLIIALISLYTAAQKPSITNVTFEAPVLNEDVKIAFISDTHFGATVGVKRANNLKEIIEENNPNIIVFVGDIFETNAEKSLPFTEIIANISNGKKFGVLGNHEYYQGLENARTSFKKAGINLLENKNETENQINIIGINDIRTARISKQEFNNILKQNIKPGNFNLLLTHTPMYFEEAAQNGVDLMLSGHNHNGQIWPFNYIVKLTTPYLQGHFKYENSNLYVNSGTFFWGPPMRLGSKNEVVFITLKGRKN